MESGNFSKTYFQLTGNDYCKGWFSKVEISGGWDLELQVESISDI